MGGKESHDRLYRVKYTDGDLEHLTADQVTELSCPVEDFMLAKQAQAPREQNVEAPADDHNAEHVANAVQRDIAKSAAAVKGAPKAAGKAKAKLAPTAVSKKPARA